MENHPVLHFISLAGPQQPGSQVKCASKSKVPFWGREALSVKAFWMFTRLPAFNPFPSDPEASFFSGWESMAPRGSNLHSLSFKRTCPSLRWNPRRTVCRSQCVPRMDLANNWGKEAFHYLTYKLCHFAPPWEENGNPLRSLRSLSFRGYHHSSLAQLCPWAPGYWRATSTPLPMARYKIQHRSLHLTNK